MIYDLGGDDIFTAHMYTGNMVSNGGIKLFHYFHATALNADQIFRSYNHMTSSTCVTFNQAKDEVYASSFGGITAGGPRYLSFETYTASTKSEKSFEEFILPTTTPEKFMAFGSLDFQNYAASTAVGACVSLFDRIIESEYHTFDFSTESGSYGYFSSTTRKLLYTSKANKFIECLGNHMYGT